MFRLGPTDWRGTPEAQKKEEDAQLGKLLRELDQKRQELTYCCISCGKRNHISVTTIVESLESLKEKTNEQAKTNRSDANATPKRKDRTKG